MAEDTTPVSIGVPRREPRDPAAESIGHAAAGMLEYLIDVIDREDRLESGSGAWRATFAADDAAAPEAVRRSVLRLLRLAADAENFAVLEILASAEGASPGDVAAKLGVGRLTLAERISDLVSAGLLVKLPEADQVRATAAGKALIALVDEAVRAGSRDLQRGGR